MKIEKIPISRINAATYNPRKDLKPGDAEWDKLVRSIEDFGFVEPLVWNKRTSLDDGSFDVTSTGFSEEEIEALVTSTPERPQDIPLKPYQKVHILLSFPPAIMPKVSAAIDKVRNIQGVEYEQSAN